MKRNYLIRAIFMVALHLTFCTTAVFSQTTEFSYQGFLSNDSASANGNFDFEFRLFENVNGGIAVATRPRPNVTVINGVFSVALDFGNFPAADRFLEIGVRPAGGGALITLAPRSKLLSTPYATNAINAQNAANAQTAATATNATNAQNAQNAQTAVNAQNAQTAQNALQLGGVQANQFVLTGDVRLNNARNPLPGSPSYIQNSTAPQTATNFNISGNGTTGGILTGRIINAATQYNINGFAVLSTPGTFNLFVGNSAGRDNTNGFDNSFFGILAGSSNTTGNDNSFFGETAGGDSSTGSNNSFFGARAGLRNTTGSDNTFFGIETGRFSTTGNSNLFFGNGAGAFNISGDSNTMIGFEADLSGSNFTNATAIGAKASVGRSNALVLGSIAGVNGATDSTNVGIGTSTPSETLDVNGIIRVSTLGAAGSTALCRNIARNQISTCSSSLRYKTNIAPFSYGLNLVNQLKPIAFNWKEGGMRDLGLGAEDVEKIEPLLVTYNDKSEVEGVKYDRVAVILLNAVKEQQTQIEQQQTENNNLKAQIDEQQRQLFAQQTQLDRHQLEIKELSQTLKQITHAAAKTTIKGSEKQ